eukprot:7235307-Ditylum_brightwellii.AAC.1
MSEMAPINTHSKDKDCSVLAMLAGLSPEAVSNPCARGELSDPCVSDCTNTHALSSPDEIAHAIAITPASTLFLSSICSASAPQAHKCAWG